MIYNEINLSGWDPRTQEVVRTHNHLTIERYKGWMRLCKGDIKGVECEYLRHIGLWAFNNARLSYKHDRQDAIPLFKETKKIFELLEEFDNTVTGNLSGLARQYIEFCDNYLLV